MDIKTIQKELSKNKWDAYIITRNNMFLGQDILPSENKILELCGFTGSSGTLIIFKDKNYLLVDGRYEIQAAQETDPSAINVVCTTDSTATWLQKNTTTPLTIAYDPWCHSINETDYWNRTLKQHHFIEDTKQILGPRISSNQSDIFEHDIEFAGLSVDEKISYITNFIQENKLDGYFLCEPDSVSWLLNLRSHTLPNTPILRAFSFISKNGEISLFTTNFNTIEKELSAYKGQNIGISTHSTPKQIHSIFKKLKIWTTPLQNPIQKWKSIKNAVELQGFKNAHLRDAIALCSFLYWFENNWQGQTELSIVEKLYSLRKQNKYFQGNSFETIAGFAANGAIVHYQPSTQTNQKLQSGSVLLLDSGAQYLDATTDVTRTIAVGHIENQQIIDSFTQVLKSHIAVATAKFPQGTSGNTIDALARQQLWQFGKEYKHGTGHGVGCFLNVHEGPFSISSSRNQSPLEAGQITSIEPGYYVENQYGIRIENLAYICQDNNPNFPNPMLKFEPLTLVPIDKRLINKYLLTKQELLWLNEYHQTVFRHLNQVLPAEMQSWLSEACAPI